MANCKLTKSLDNKNCEYSIAGASEGYLLNYFPARIVTAGEGEPPAAVANRITYVQDADGRITQIIPPTGEQFYKIGAAAGTLGATDALLAGANGGKYRQHTINYVLNQDDEDLHENIDALSLGRFVGVVVANSGKIKVYGRDLGLSAPANGADHNTGLAEADATGWTGILQGNAMEAAPLVSDIDVITPINEVEVVPGAQGAMVVPD